MLYPSVSPSGSDAVGLKLYAVPTFAEVLGVPEIVGARFVVPELAAFTVIANEGRHRAP
jgi:hypothetical protein